jgi:hypothetical protein
MSNGAEWEVMPDGDGRVIDRSGDIDQRPPGEHPASQNGNCAAFQRTGNAGSFRPSPPESDYAANLPVPVAQAYLAEPAPAQNFRTPPRQLADMAQRLQKDLDKQYTRAKSQLESLAQKIEAQEKRCAPPKLDGSLQQTRFERQKLLIANGPALADLLRDEKSRLADLEAFKAGNRISRDAHYPASPVLAFGVLSILIIVEAGINGVLFADSSDQGLFGGWLEALVLSIANVGLAFLFGRVALPQLHRQGVAAKAAAAVLCLAGVAAIAAINITGAHYRDFRPEANPAPALAKPEANLLPAVTSAPLRSALHNSAKPASALPPPPPPQFPAIENAKTREREAIAKLFRAPFDFGSFLSIFLFVIGLCGAAIAALDGYKFDDPFPGYGRRHRKYALARLRTAEGLRRILGQSNTIMTGSFQAINRKIEDFSAEMSALLNLHQAYLGSLKTLRDALQEAAEDADAQIAAHSRLLNKTSHPDYVDQYSVAIRSLPPLPEKQIKFYEAQERKLKALQKSAQKEQGDILGLFETASADFQKLLSGASQASLQAALSVACENQSEGAA